MLQPLLALLETHHQIIPFMGAEIEWYVTNQQGEPVGDALRGDYLKLFASQASSLPLHSVEKEDGSSQVEAALHYSDNIAQLISDLADLKQHASDVAKQMSLVACFQAKPFAQDYGNGLHIHIHLEDVYGNWLYRKTATRLSPYLAYSISGLLNTMRDNIKVLAGNQEAYARFTAGFNAPTHVSWGTNNRTTALRLPDTHGHRRGKDTLLESVLTQPSSLRRIEHRVASSESDCEIVICAILKGIIHGLEAKDALPKAVHGDASNEQYECMPLV